MTAAAAVRSSEVPELTVQSFAACEVQRGFRLQGAPVDADTIYLVLAGTMHLTLPGTRLVAPAGSLVFVPPGLQPAIAPVPGPAINVVATRNVLMQRAGLLVFDAAHGTAGDLRVMVGRVTGGLSPLLDTLGAPTERLPLAADLTDMPLAQAAYGSLLAELDHPASLLVGMSAALMKVCLLLFLREVDRGDPIDEPGTNMPTSRLAGVIAMIRARPSDRFTLDGLAAAAGMSRATFSRHFLEAAGTSPMDFVQQARLQEAAAMLRATELSIKQVAAEAGFQSRSHFTRAFIAAFGTNPTSFRSDAREPGGPLIGQD